MKQFTSEFADILMPLIKLDNLTETEFHALAVLSCCDVGEFFKKTNSVRHFCNIFFSRHLSPISRRNRLDRACKEDASFRWTSKLLPKWAETGRFLTKTWQFDDDCTRGWREKLFLLLQHSLISQTPKESKRKKEKIETLKSRRVACHSHIFISKCWILQEAGKLMHDEMRLYSTLFDFCAGDRLLAEFFEEWTSIATIFSKFFLQSSDWNWKFSRTISNHTDTRNTF